MLLLALAVPNTWAADFLQVDAGAPGMAVQVNILREAGGFTGSEVVTTACSDITIATLGALDRAADPANPIAGAVLQTVFFIDSGASPQDCIVSIDGTPMSTFNTGIDNRFSIVNAESAPVDGGTNDADGAADGVITISSSLRSDGGTVVFESLTVANGETLIFDLSDPDGSSAGNEAYLPLTVLVEGTATINGTVDVSGEDGDTTTNAYPSDGGSGGPGGGGGGAGSECVSNVIALAGDGFSGGGGAPTSSCTLFTNGGIGAAEGNDGEDGGEGVFTDVANAAAGYAGGSGGGTGMFWGTGGIGGYCCGTSGDGGFGGGGATGHSEASGWGSGGGGFGTDGENGTGTVGAPSDTSYRVGGAGYTNGDDSLVPLAGGSGGGSGDSGSGTGDSGGGGGGGGLLLVADTLSIGANGLFDARGGDGGDCRGVNPGSSTGGGAGSGGGLFLAASTVSGLVDAAINVHGGYGGVEGSGVYFSGDGGEGRLRVDGTAPPSLTTGPTGDVGSTFEGPVVRSVSDTEITIRSSGAVTAWIFDSTGAFVTDVSIAADGTEDLYDDFSGGGTFHVVLVDDATGVVGPAGTVTIEYTPDLDGDGYDDALYGGTDCDDNDATVYPGATEVCDSVDNDCDGTVDEDSAADATTWYYDLDNDGYGDPSNAVTSCTQPSFTTTDASDCDDRNRTISPAATEVCDGLDNDCDGAIDDDDSDLDTSTADTWYSDVDGDGFGDAASTVLACDQPSATSDNDDDCDDAAAAVNPDADELCDTIDNDCDGEVDEDDAIDASVWYGDNDGDGYGGDRFTTTACDQPEGYAATDDDCDDGDAAFHPGAPETDCADPNDYNCDGSVGFADVDGDGFAACEECDDGNADINPEADEVCDATDNDCDGTVDGPDALDASIWHADADGDGFGDPDVTTTACDQPEGFLDDTQDCDDTDPATYPGAAEIADDGIDQDCDGQDLTDGGGLDDTGIGGEDKGGEGCGCASATRSSEMAMWTALLGLLALGRRRRRHAAT
ncbi:MAG: putative metal-binding motif-containing protein [Alphaproteobacteria bacterium]|nr:putative metal-binding motif-containing protein [Alphaproteobacteria bacterium]